MKKFIIDDDLDILDMDSNQDIIMLKAEIKKLKVEIDYLRTEIDYIRNKLNY